MSNTETTVEGGEAEAPVAVPAVEETVAPEPVAETEPKTE